MSSNKGESDSNYIFAANGTIHASVLLVRVFDCDPETAAQRMRKSPPFSKTYLLDRYDFGL